MIRVSGVAIFAVTPNISKNKESRNNAYFFFLILYRS